MTTVIVATDQPRITNGVPPPRGATLASFVFFASLAALLSLLYAGSEWWHLVGGFGFPTDTAWVRATIARNLATGQGLCFNPGTPAAGAAGSSWIIALALGGLLGANYLAVAKVLGVISIAIASWFVWCIVLDLVGDWRFAFIAGLIVVASPLMISQGLGGTEAAWAALWLMAAIHWQAASWDGSNRIRIFGAIALGLAALSRPELILLLPLALLDRWIAVIRRDPPGERFAGLLRSLPEIIGAVAVVAPFVIYNMRAGGPLWQQPTFALRQPSLYTWPLATLNSLAADNPVVLAAALIGIPVTVLFASRAHSRHPSLLLVLTTVTMLVAPQFIWRQASADNGILTATYLAPLVAVLAAAGLFLLHRTVRQRAASRRNVLAGSIALACTAVFGFFLYTHPTDWREHGIQVKKVNDLQVFAGKWAAEHLPTDASIASREVGAIAFFSRRRTIDLGGTIASDARSYMSKPGSLDTNLLEYLMKAHPSHLAIKPSEFPDLAKRADLLTPTVTYIFRDPVSGGETTMALYETPWPPLSVMEARRQARRER